MCCVTGTSAGGNAAKINWWVYNAFGNPEAEITSGGTSQLSDKSILTGAVGGNITYNGLSISAEETKIILDVYLCTDGPASSKFWGLYFLNPKPETTNGYFHTVMVFTPKYGLFTLTAPAA
jgi:hypothetical protein